MNKTILLKKGLVIGIVFLFIGVGVYPAIAVEPIISNNITQEEEFEQVEETEAKEYLFQTIIDIANNPDANGLLNQIEDGWKNDNRYISWDFNCKSVFQKLLLSKPNILFSILFTETSITHEYLESSYNRGCKVANALGEENVIEIVESVEINNPEILDELYNLIINNEELYDRIITLSEMNEGSGINLPFSNLSVICKILLVLFSVYLIRCGIVDFFTIMFHDNPIILVILDLLWFKNWIFAGACMAIFKVIDDTLGC